MINQISIKVFGLLQGLGESAGSFIATRVQLNNNSGPGKTLNVVPDRFKV